KLSPDSPLITYTTLFRSVGAEPAVGREDVAEAHRDHADREHDQRNPHRAVRADGAEQNHHHAEHQEVPGRDGVDVLRDRERGAVDRKSTRLNSSHVSISY